MNVALVVGARPNFMKVAPILAVMRDHPELTPFVIHTGQHFDDNMSGRFFRDLGIPAPDANLNVGADAPALPVAAIMTRLALILREKRPDLLVVVGDVDSTLAGALVAVKTGIQVAHVEAGLRSFDRTMPEEINRVLTDALAHYCFTTEPAANENLQREGVGRERIHYVGNVMIDTLLRFRQCAAASRVLDDLGLAAKSYVLLTLHRPSNVDAPGPLARVFAALGPIARDVPIVFPVHPRTRRQLTPDVVVPGVAKALRLVEPLAYLDFVRLMETALGVLTDSGGVQEETTALGVPCLTLRTTTERPVTISDGTNRLVGIDAARISGAWDEIREGRWPAGRMPPLWDGRAAERVVKVLAGSAR